MKKYLLLIVVAAGLAACGNNETKETPETTSEAAPAEATVVVPAGQTDPICKMEREKGWTDHAVSATGDTTWFCSATCKDVFVARNK